MKATTGLSDVRIVYGEIRHVRTSLKLFANVNVAAHDAACQRRPSRRGFRLLHETAVDRRADGERDQPHQGEDHAGLDGQRGSRVFPIARHG